MNRANQSGRAAVAVWAIVSALAGASWGQTAEVPVRKTRPRPPTTKVVRRSPLETSPSAFRSEPLDHFARLILAGKLSSQGRHAEVLDLLAEVEAGRQHWEYGFLRSRTAGLSLRQTGTIGEMRGRLLAVEFSPDGSMVAAGGTAGVVYVIDTATGSRVRTIHGHRGRVRCLKFHPEGQLLASGGDDGFVRIWHAEIGLEIRHLPKQYQGILDICFAPDGTTIATACLDGGVKLWGLSDGKEILCLGQQSSGVAAVAYSPDGGTLASMNLRGDVLIWDISSGEQQNLLGEGRKLDEASIAFSPDGRSLAAGYPGSAAIWNVETGEKTLNVGRASNAVCKVAFTPDGGGLLTARDHTVCLWDIATGRAVSRMTARSGPAHSLALSHDGSAFALGGVGQIRLLSSPIGDAHRVLGRTGSRPTCLGFGGEGTELLVGGPDGCLTWHLGTGAKLPGERRPERTLAFSRDGTLVASATLLRELVVRERSTDRVLMKTHPLKRAPAVALFTHDNSQLFTAEWDKKVLLWQVSGGRRVWSSGTLAGPVVSLALSPGGRFLAAAVRDRSIAVFDMESGKAVHHINEPCTAVAYSRQGVLAAAGRDRAIRLLDPVSGRVRVLLRGHEDNISALAFSEDGKRLASGGADGTVRVWAPHAGVELVKLDAGRTWITAVAFNAEAGHLAAADHDGQVHLWESDRVYSPRQERWFATEEVLRPTALPAPPAEDKRPAVKQPIPILRH